MARPRCRAANQPRMSRPLAAYTEAPAAAGHGQAGTERHHPVHGGGQQQHHPGQRQPAAEDQPLTPPVSGRAPGHQREQQPGRGQATSTPAWTRDSPSARKAGMR